MAATDAAIIGGEFDAARVIRRAVDVLRSRWLQFLVPGLVLVAAPQFAYEWLQLHPTLADGAGSGRVLGYTLLPFDQGLICLFQGIVTLAVVSDMGGYPPGNLRQVFARLAPRAASTFVNGMIAYAGMIAGAILLVVPGLMLATAWSMSIPAAAAEGRGPLAAFGRSLELTRGHRWPLFGLAMVCYAIAVVGSWAFALAFGGGLSLTAAMKLPFYALVFSPLENLALEVVVACGIASAYVELATLKGGPLRSQLASVFD